MRKILGLACLLFSVLANAQTFPVQNLQVNGTSSFAGSSTFNGITTFNQQGTFSNGLVATGVNSINGYAPTVSPTFTGIPTVPTPTVGTNSIQIANTAFVAAHSPCPSILDNGGNNGGSVDNTAAFAATAALGPSGQACVYFPPGTYAFSGQVSYTLASSGSVTIIGAGAGVSKLVWAAGGGLKLNYPGSQNSAYIANLSILTGTTNTGVGLFLNGTGSSGNAAAALTNINNVSVNGSDGVALTDYWATGIEISNVSNVNLTGVQIVGAGASYQTNGQGLYLVGASNASQTVQVNLQGCVLQYVGVGLNYGSNTEGVTVTASNFTGDSNGIDVTGSVGSTSGLSVTMSQFNSNVNAVLIPNGIDGLFFVGNYFELPYNGGSTVVGLNMGKQSSAVMIGNVFERIGSSGTGLNGIVIAGPSTLPGMISGNTFESLGTGIWLQSTSDFVNVQSNVYQGNGTNVLNQGNGGTSVCPPTSSANCVGGGSI